MYNRPRGTEDVYGDYSDLFQIIESRIAQVGKQFGFREIRTPIFEATELFVRSVGETSDIVKKEFYNFKDKGDRDIVLRPEGTAGVIRAVVEEKLLNKFPLPLRLMYHGPMFRYERPQSGRLRQFNQFGFEIIGTNTIADDIEILLLSVAILDAIEIKN
jgi:histidyl-tRNA synthetase